MAVCFVLPTLLLIILNVNFIRLITSVREKRAIISAQKEFAKVGVYFPFYSHAVVLLDSSKKNCVFYVYIVVISNIIHHIVLV